VSASSENGLELFDDAASAVGNFPSALRGYDRSAVDDYVRSLEGALVQTRRRAAGLEQQMVSLQEQLNESLEKQRAQEVDYTNLGGRASEILRLAEEQSREVLEQANENAERVKETARREADQMRAEAARAGNEIKSQGIAEIERLRTHGQNDIREQVEKAQAQAEAIVAAARREAEALQRAAEHEAQTLRQTAYLDTEQLRREVEREAAEIRSGVAAEREAAVGHLRAVHEEAVTKTSALLTEATEYHQQAKARLDGDIAQAAQIRAEALAEAEQVKLRAAKEAEGRISAARRQAAAITDRTQQEFAWRKQQLRRETDLLGQRKAAVLNQLASLSALAEQTAHSFPDLEDLEDIDDLDEFDGEEGDRTIMMPAAMPPSLPSPESAEDHDQAAEESSTETRVFPAVAHLEESRQEADQTTVSVVPPAPLAEGASDESVEVDGDATVMVPPSQLPAGTAHLRGGAEPHKG